MQLKKRKLILFLVSSILLITFTFYGYQICFTPNILVDRESSIILIEKGTTFSQLQSQFIKGEVVNDIVSFSFLARLYDYDQRIRPGRYVLLRNMNNLEAIEVLKAGKQEPVNVTYSYARYVTDVTDRIAKNLAVKPSELTDELNKFALTNQLGFNKDNLLALFIPNTYEIFYDITSEELMDRLIWEYESFWNEERIQKSKVIGLTPVEVSVLASIVQAEMAKEEEAPTIAGLYINRLKKNIALQADPTLVYALGDFTIKRVLNEHKEVESPYNTYKYVGLPPGPINMPQIAMIDAVLNYEKHNYIYMCAREDFSGYHNFSSNLNTHLQNARKYQQALTVEQRKARVAKKSG
ncbi:MAG: endolytic transglycosylase MltG [Flammeovirgaceae bacterium]|nr:endolytic transglycosylase MltG [Flammeovirgaceae bacterium]